MRTLYENAILIDYSKDSLFDEYALRLLRDYYLLSGESSPQQALARAAVAYCEGDTAFAQRIYDYASDGWFMFSSPVLSNAPPVGGTSKALPISCYLQYVPNSLKGLIEHSSEERWLTTKGGGIGAHWSSVQASGSLMRSGGSHPGLMGFLHTHDSDMLAYQQAATRKGSYAGFLNVSHPEILEFIGMRTPEGDLGKQNLNLHHGVCISDSFLYAVSKGAPWDLIDPATGVIMDTVPARAVWEQILTTRSRTGEPYLINTDEANSKMNPAQRAKGLRIRGSNLCSEIYLPTSEARTAVCCLSSVNLAKWHDWKDHPLFVGDLIRLLDNVLTYFIRHAPPELAKAVHSAKMERSLGLGAMGFHTLLQDSHISWESSAAISLNRFIFKHLRDKAREASKALAAELGEAPDLVGTGMRNAYLMAIAPNANNSIILGVSPSVEPNPGVAYARDTRAGTGFYRSPAFARLLKDKYPAHDTKETWDSIILSGGSVRHLSFLSNQDAAVFRTAYEIDQNSVVTMARSRQEFIDQGQSINLFFEAGAPKWYVHEVHWRAFDQNSPFDPLKGLYYYRTESAHSAGVSVARMQRVPLQNGECIACEG